MFFGYAFLQILGMALKQKTVLDWDDLRIFAEVARRGNFSAAGKALRLNHVTISRRIARLDDQFGEALLIRQDGGLHPSPLGERLLVQANLMQHAADGASGLKEQTKGLNGVIKISTLSLGAKLLAPYLKQLTNRYPQIHFQLDITERNVNLSRREADLALRLARPRDKHLRSRKLAEIGYGLYATKAILKTLKNNRAPPLIAYDHEHRKLPEAQWLQVLLPQGQIVAQATSATAQLELAASGLGICALPHYLAATRKELFRLPHNPELLRELWLLAHPTVATAPRLRVLLSYLTELTPSERNRLRHGH